MTLADANGYLALAERTHANLSHLADVAGPLEPGQTARDWLLTMHFYVIVAYVNALAATCGRRFADHGQRRDWIKSHPPLRSVASEYMALDGWSRDARYEGVVPRSLDDAHRSYRAVIEAVVPLLKAAGIRDAKSLPPVDFE